MCTLVRIHVPLQIEWTHGEIAFACSLLSPQYSESTVLKLTLGKTNKSEAVVSSAFNDIHGESVLLTQKACE